MASRKPHLEGASDLEKLHDLCKRTHKEQAVWFLNAFWEDFASQEAEKLWHFVSIAIQIDNAKEAGVELDELEAHRFLEKADEAHTVLEMRARLRNTGAIGQNERPKNVPLTHYLLFKYDAKNPKLFHELVTRAQGDNQKQIEEAQAKLDAVSVAFAEASRTADAAAASLKEAISRENAAKAAEDAAKAREADAKAREAAAKKAETEAHASAEAAKVKEAEAVKSAATLAVREEEVRKSQAELEAALAEVKKQEDAYNAKTAQLKKQSEDESVGVVSRNKAKNELAQHLAEDPLPLRQAKITAEAAVRKAEKATKAAGEARGVAEADAVKASEARSAAEAAAVKASQARHQAEHARAEAEAARQKAEETRRQAEEARQKAEAAREQAEDARRQAEKARAAAEADKQAADDAVDAAQAAVAEAEAYLAEQKANPGNSHGALWWMDRELHEKKKYMPMRKGGISK